MREVIETWGFPIAIKKLNNSDIKFVFDSSELGEERKYYENLHCKDGSVKFCIYDFKNKKILFSMDFFESDSILNQMRGLDSHIKLELLNVNEPSLRRQGVASYYLDKLIEYVAIKGFKFIRVLPNNEANIFKKESNTNRLNMEELKNFYKRHSTSEVKVNLIEY